jgi:hypothetical protein
VSRLVAAALLALAAAMALGGSFGAFSIYRFESEYTEPTTSTTTGWGTTEEPVSEEAATVDILHGIPLSVAAALALVAAVLLVLTARRPGDPAPGRLLGVGAVGLLVGVVAVVWLELITFARSVASVQETAGGAGFRSSLQIGSGGYLILAAALAALVAAVLLLVPRRGAGPVPPAPAQPFGPGLPQWTDAAQWAPPRHGPAAPQPGWGPPPAPPAHHE